MKKAILILSCLLFALSGCSDDDNFKKGSSHATMKIDGVLYEFTDFQTGYVPITDASGDAALSLYTRGDRVNNTAEHREHLVIRFYRGGVFPNTLRLAALVVEDDLQQGDWSMPDDAPWDITFIKNDDEGLHVTFQGIIRGSDERIVTDGVIDITYGDDNYGEGNSEFP
jgi:hypothetical protein